MTRRPGRGWAALSLAALAAAVFGCGGGPPPGPSPKPPPPWNAERLAEAEALSGRLAGLPPSSAGELSVHLAFGGGADLDLYVTGPREETVYYANSPSRIGGELRADRRCVHEAPRIETVRFAAPLIPGRYRIGVDYPDACDDSKAPAAFAVRVEGPGVLRELEALATHRVFEPVVLEFEVGVPPDREGGER